MELKNNLRQYRFEHRQISQQEVPALPVLDGLSAAGGRLYLSLKDGCVVCLAAKQE